ncbi:MAG TPA: DegT/DnrJ/EryC1/StrS family aminotransferase [Candidatus Polarisedimenticolia bacterium]|nr:DegT/DnrJ/EryC1/StrS family aminotransferase [Candidatus Polarisedimenticolia bacterium]
MAVPLLDLKAQYRTLEPEMGTALRRVFESQQFVLGEEVAAFEREISARLGGVHAVGVASGTDALLLALMALDIGEKKDEVLTSPFSFFATAGAIHRAGAKPVFVDIDPGTFLLRPELVEKAITPRSRAVMPVHLFGQMADMEALHSLASRHRLAVIEDAAQALGASSGDEGQAAQAGVSGTFGCFSFFPSKNLGGAGDGGLVTTRDAALAERVRSLRQHGEEAQYIHRSVGLNSRLDAVQAAVLRVKLAHLEDWNAGRAANARRYEALFREAGLAGEGGPVTLPRTRPGARHIFHQYVIRARRRDDLKTALKKAGIGCAVYYPLPLHLQECFAYLGYHKGDFPAAEAAAHEVLALPIYPELSAAMQREVVAAVADFYASPA